MKKTLLMAAAALAAGVISTQAQVYSQNVVGYYNLNLVAGYNMVANQFTVGNSNGLNEIFPSIPDSTFVYQWNGFSAVVTNNIINNCIWKSSLKIGYSFT